ncbi:hypothetical protein [Amycolatopsis saalfeldensis]|uniref:Uncharacterized protein n=1 Tax=Amycolatopsis saalfeldensis TaxID=394193 RepID=A0A1H8Y3V6_9PSEU|nr:hypothetical protein [Amycolatopsis saalfeldensis]SEP46970.1 hypothetical protein SAMN04489732_1116 [Amycolatopsis saalfeldensis]
MPAYTYLIQVLPRGGGSWATLREPRTGAPLSGTFGVLEAAEDGLPEAAMAAMAGFRSMGLKLRIAFWAGSRINERLYSNEISCMVHSDGSVVTAEEIQQEARNQAEGKPRVRPDCPHAPHDAACGHAGSCGQAHRGAECEAVRPACPACFQEVRPTAIPALVEEIRRTGDLVLRCSSCEALAFEFDTDLVCGTCHWLVPGVNEELEDQYFANGGEFEPPPGSCPGCSGQMPGLDRAFSLDCPKCGCNVFLTLDKATPGGTITTMCPDSACGEFISLPATIWCQECGQNLRSPEVVRKLTLAANALRLPDSVDSRESEDVRLARRLANAAESLNRRYSHLTQEQKNLLLDRGFLDSLISSPSPLADWVRDAVEMRAIGHERYREGGMRALRETHQRIMELGLDHRVAARTVEQYWGGIGDWMS